MATKRPLAEIFPITRDPKTGEFVSEKHPQLAELMTDYGDRLEQLSDDVAYEMACAIVSDPEFTHDSPLWADLLALVLSVTGV